jgi:hypothetical protein
VNVSIEFSPTNGKPSTKILPLNLHM